MCYLDIRKDRAWYVRLESNKITYPPLHTCGWKQLIPIPSWWTGTAKTMFKARIPLIQRRCGCRSGCDTARYKCKKTSKYCGPGCKCKKTSKYCSPSCKYLACRTYLMRLLVSRAWITPSRGAAVSLRKRMTRWTTS